MVSDCTLHRDNIYSLSVIHFLIASIAMTVYHMFCGFELKAKQFSEKWPILLPSL